MDSQANLQSASLRHYFEHRLTRHRKTTAHKFGLLGKPLKYNCSTCIRKPQLPFFPTHHQDSEINVPRTLGLGHGHQGTATGRGALTIWTGTTNGTNWSVLWFRDCQTWSWEAWTESSGASDWSSFGKDQPSSYGDETDPCMLPCAFKQIEFRLYALVAWLAPGLDQRPKSSIYFSRFPQKSSTACRDLSHHFDTKSPNAIVTSHMTVTTCAP